MGGTGERGGPGVRGCERGIHAAASAKEGSMHARCGEGYTQRHQCMVVEGCGRPWHPGVAPNFCSTDGAVRRALGQPVMPHWGWGAQRDGGVLCTTSVCWLANYILEGPWHGGMGTDWRKSTVACIM